MAFGLSYPRYLLSSHEATLKASKFYRKPGIALTQSIWNLQECGATSELSKITFESIHINRKLYIPAERNWTPNQIDVQTPNSIPVRLLYNHPLHFHKDRKSKSFCLCCEEIGEPASDLSTIMIHIHGGGFLALSSKSTQVYTRPWAKQLNIPVFSIDYRMPPNHPYPTAPEDCLKAYEFIVNHIHLYMNIRPKKIILTGDSAGGNLACSLVTQIMQRSILMPYALYIAYPAVDLRLQYSPSKIHSINDPLLSPSVLLLCLREYLNQDLQKAY